jgi:hypothetical protein
MYNTEFCRNQFFPQYKNFQKKKKKKREKGERRGAEILEKVCCKAGRNGTRNLYEIYSEFYKDYL